MLFRRFMTVPNLRRPPIFGVCLGSGTVIESIFLHINKNNNLSHLEAVLDQCGQIDQSVDLQHHLEYEVVEEDQQGEEEYSQEQLTRGPKAAAAEEELRRLNCFSSKVPILSLR